LLKKKNMGENLGKRWRGKGGYYVQFAKKKKQKKQGSGREGLGLPRK